MPHLDKAARVERAYVAEQARKALRDRTANAARIREQLADGTAGISGRRPKSARCGVCGAPFGGRTRPRICCDECASNFPKGKMETNQKEVI